MYLLHLRMREKVNCDNYCEEEVIFMQVMIRSTVKLFLAPLTRGRGFKFCQRQDGHVSVFDYQEKNEFVFK